jgi:hypothetical protein
MGNGVAGRGGVTVILWRRSLNGESWSIAMAVRHAPRSSREENEAGESKVTAVGVWTPEEEAAWVAD